MEAIYVSVWDGGIEIRTTCDYDPETNYVSCVEDADVDGLDILEDEYIELPDGTNIRDFNVGQESEDLSPEDIERLKKIFLYSHK